MGRKSKGRSNSLSTNNNSNNSSISVREMMRGLKNRWGRFQCPRDGSICKSLEAWHWHRHKHHQTEHINYVELDPDVADDAPGATPQPTTAPPSSSFSSSHPPLLLSPSSPRLLPPEAFAPRRQPEVHFPDDASDLTEPDAPVLLLLSEEVTSREEEAPPTGSGEAEVAVVQWEVMDESTSVADDDEEEEEQIGGSRQQQRLQITMATTTADARSLVPEAAAAASRLHGNDSHGNQESKMAVMVRDFRATQSPGRETNVHRHGNGAHSNLQRERYYRPRSHERSLEHAVQPPHCPASTCPASSGPASSGSASSGHASIGPASTGPASTGPASTGPASSGPTTTAALSSAMDLVAVYVLRLLEKDNRSPRPTAQDILREVESHFQPALGLSRDGLEGVVAGALMGARDQWTNGYNAGWKDGAKEVLNAPLLLRSVTPSPLHSPDGVATWNSNVGQVTLLTPGRSGPKGEKEDDAEKIVQFSGNSIENVETSAEQSSDVSTHHHSNDPNNNDASS